MTTGMLLTIIGIAAVVGVLLFTPWGTALLGFSNKKAREATDPVEAALIAIEKDQKDLESAEEAADQVSGDVDRCERELTAAQTEVGTIVTQYENLMKRIEKGENIPNVDEAKKRLGAMMDTATATLNEKTKQLADAHQASENAENDIKTISDSIEEKKRELQTMKSQTNQAKVLTTLNKINDAQGRISARQNSFAESRQRVQAQLDSAKAHQKRGQGDSTDKLLKDLKKDESASSGLNALETARQKRLAGNN